MLKGVVIRIFWRLSLSAFSTFCDCEVIWNNASIPRLLHNLSFYRIPSQRIFETWRCIFDNVATKNEYGYNQNKSLSHGLGENKDKLSNSINQLNYLIWRISMSKQMLTFTYSRVSLLDSEKCIASDIANKWR